MMKRMTGITTCASCGSSLFEDAGRCYECGAILPVRRFILEISHADGRVEKIGSPGDEITLGRATDNDVVLMDRRISRHHLRFKFRDDGAWVEEFGATNPCSISGRPIGSGTLFVPGARLELSGGTIMLSRHG